MEAADRGRRPAKEVIEAQYQDAIRLQIDNLYTAWIDVLAARETIRYLRASLESLVDLLEATEALLDQGAAIPSDVNRIEILRDSTELALPGGRGDAARRQSHPRRHPLPAAGRGRDAPSPRLATRPGSPRPRRSMN